LALWAACFSTGAASAQDSKGRSRRWDNLKFLTPGQKICIVMMNVEIYEGKFKSLSDDGITLRHAAGEQMLAHKDILCISWKSAQSHQTRNALIGLAVGTGAGLGIGLAANNVIWSRRTCTEGPQFACASPPNPHWADILTPVGALAGIAFGTASSKGWQEVYRA
jgi:hypothetical protein